MVDASERLEVSDGRDGDGEMDSTVNVERSPTRHGLFCAAPRCLSPQGGWRVGHASDVADGGLAVVHE